MGSIIYRYRIIELKQNMQTELRYTNFYSMNTYSIIYEWSNSEYYSLFDREYPFGIDTRTISSWLLFSENALFIEFFSFRVR